MALKDQSPAPTASGHEDPSKRRAAHIAIVKAMGGKPGYYTPEVVANLPSQKGKYIAVTGTTSGIGFIFAREAARAGATVVLLNRQSSRADEALKRLKEAIPEGVFATVECNLNSFDSVRKCAEVIRRDYPSLDVMFNNAGIMASPDKATEDGYDCQMQVNHLSHFLLNSLIMPSLEACAEQKGEARIVSQSSVIRTEIPKLQEKYLQKNGDGNLGGDGTGQGGPAFTRYGHSKLANLVYINALHQKLAAKASKVKAVCVHPGACPTPLFKNIGMIARFFIWAIGATVEDTVSPSLIGCLQTHAAVTSGDFYGPTGMYKGAPVKIEITDAERNQDQMDMLWRLSEEAVGAFKV